MSQIAGHAKHQKLLKLTESAFQENFTVICGLWYCAVRDRPQGLLCMLIMLIRTDFPALRGGTVPLSARYGWCLSDVEKAFIV